MAPEFGENIEYVAPLRDALKIAPELKPAEARIVLMEKYEAIYGIFNHDLALDRPLSLIAMHPGEDYSPVSHLYERIEQFATKQIPKWFGLSLTEFLDLPTDICMRILETASKLQEKDGQTTSNFLESIENRAKK